MLKKCKPEIVDVGPGELSKTGHALNVLVATTMTGSELVVVAMTLLIKERRDLLQCQDAVPEVEEEVGAEVQEQE